MLISLIGVYLVKNKNIFVNDEPIYFKGSLYTANHAANMLDYVSNDENIVISPYGINYSLALLYNGTDNNSKKEIKNYFTSHSNEINETILEKQNLFHEESKEKNKYNDIYESYVEDLYEKEYDKHTIDTLDLLSDKEKDALILLLKKIELSYERINKLNELSEKNIKNYKLTDKDITYNSYQIKSRLEIALDNYETYNIENTVNNYTEIYLNNLREKDIYENFKNKTEKFEYNITSLYKEETIDKVKLINDNIKTITKDKISRIIEAPEISEENAILINSLYFNYEWNTSFKNISIAPTEFSNNDGTISIVSMMYEQHSEYLENEYAKAFKKDFEGGKYSFVGILPNQKDFTLSSLNIDSLLNSKRKGNINIGLPKFEYQSKIDTKDLLSNYNINEIFTSNANFSQMLEEPTYIEQMIQKNSITIGEKGTVETNIIKNQIENHTMDTHSKEIILNRPFAYLIINNETKDILLIGKVVKFHEGS